MAGKKALDAFVHASIQNMLTPRGQVDSVAKDFEAVGVKYCVVGGLALGAHNYIRATEDIDLLVSKDTFHLIDEKLVGLGYTYRPGSKNLHYHAPGKKIEVDILVEGENNEGFVLPSPVAIRQKLFGVWYADIRSLIILKLSSKRARDKSDVLSLIEANSLEKSWVSNVPLALQMKWLSLFD